MTNKLHLRNTILLRWRTLHHEELSRERLDAALRRYSARSILRAIDRVSASGTWGSVCTRLMSRPTRQESLRAHVARLREAPHAVAAS